jgi:alpha-beta hydrolase superfamily lysophospholipase
MMVVCVFNLVKLVCMMLLLFSVKETPLLNMGDAVSSFLDTPDPSTQGMCLAGKTEVNKHWRKKGSISVPPLTFTATSQRWCRAVSWTRWMFFGLL